MPGSSSHSSQADELTAQPKPKPPLLATSTGNTIQQEQKQKQEEKTRPSSVGQESSPLGLRSVRLTVVRHAQTSYNQRKLIQGQIDSKLTELGKEQAKLLGRYFVRKRVRFDQIYSSDLSRSVQTCEIICSQCQLAAASERALSRSGGGSSSSCSSLIPSPSLPSPIQLVPALRERSYGVYQGSSGADLRRKAIESGHNPDDLASFRPEGGETIGQVYERVRDFLLNSLLPRTRHLERILLVAHGGVIRELMRLLMQLGCPLSQRDLVVTPNTALNNFDLHLAPDNSIRYVFQRRIHKVPHLTFNVFDRDSPSGEDSGDDEEIDLQRLAAHLAGDSGRASACKRTRAENGEYISHD